MIITSTIKAAILEDNEADLKGITEAIHKSAYSVALSIFSTGSAMLEGFRKGLYHIVFLDIYLPDGSGIDIARAIRAKDDQVTIAFITSSCDHTLEGYRLGVLKYIEKPFAPSEVNEALSLAFRLFRNRETCSLVTNQGKREVALRDVRYIEVMGHTCILHLENEQLQTKLNIDQMALLLAGPEFVRCHRSYIVNLRHVREVGRDFVMTNGDRVYIRGKDEKKMADLFTRYLAAETRRLGDEQ